MCLEFSPLRGCGLRSTPLEEECYKTKKRFAFEPPQMMATRQVVGI